MYAYKKANVYDYLFRLLNLQEYKLSWKQEAIELAVYSLFSFIVPLFFKHPQALVGAAVNSVLVLAALNLRTHKILPMIIFPSIAAALGGYLFGGFTIYLVYLIPFIWIGNFILILTFKHLKFEKKKNYSLTLGAAAVLKSTALFVPAAILVYLNIIPDLFLIAMGPMQLATAILGGGIAFSAQKLKTVISNPKLDIF